LTVWLRRQEIEIRKAALFASGITDLIIKESSKNTVEAYKELIESVFPYAAKERGDTDQKLVERMKKEAEKGPITFSVPQAQSPLQKIAARMRLPDEFREKLRERTSNLSMKARRST
jgi:hypothetical protein